MVNGTTNSATYFVFPIIYKTTVMSSRPYRPIDCDCSEIQRMFIQIKTNLEQKMNVIKRTEYLISM